MDLVTALITAAAVAACVYTLVECVELWNIARNSPSKPVSGTESALGSNAVVSKEFAKLDTGAFVGRVRFDGEDWRAEYTGNLPEPPVVGQTVVISEIDSAALAVRVE